MSCPWSRPYQGSRRRQPRGPDSSINRGARLVDTSPLSTPGALCIACAGDHEDKARLFRNLLIWGLSMPVVGTLVCPVSVMFLSCLGSILKTNT